MKKSEAQQLRDILNITGDRYYDAGWRNLTCEEEKFHDWETVERIECENRRWSRAVLVITKSPTGKFFRWSYDQALTEMGEDEYYDEMPVEVVARSYTVEMQEWVKVDG